MAEKTRVAVIGTGRMGGRHARNLLAGRVKGAVLGAVCDTDAAVLEKYAGRTKTFADFREMIEEGAADAAVVATPHPLHGEITEYCLTRGVPVLCEKPLCVTAAEARKVVVCAEKTGTPAAVMLNQRTNPLYARARRLVAGGVLGEIRRVNFIITNWYRSQAYYDRNSWRGSYRGEGGGTLINQCSHQLDLLQWITGMPVSVTASCRTRNRNISAENEITAVFEYANGARCSFSASAAELRGVNRLEIAGDAGRIITDGFTMRTVLFGKSEQEVNSSTARGYGRTGVRSVRVHTSVLRTLADLPGGQQLNILRNFVAAVRGEADLMTPVAEGLNSVELINGVYMSGWTGEKTPLPVDGGRYERLLDGKRKEEEEREKERK